MQLTSSAFRNGETIPRRYTCDGENHSPPLAWTAPPKGTRSFALFCEDPDAPGGIWHHWAIFDISADRHGLVEHQPRSTGPRGPRQAQNDFRKIGYDGPCPPHGNGLHRYRFRLLALSVEHLPLKEQPSCTAVARSAQDYALGEAELIGDYER